MTLQSYTVPFFGVKVYVLIDDHIDLQDQIYDHWGVNVGGFVPSGAKTLLIEKEEQKIIVCAFDNIVRDDIIVHEAVHVCQNIFKIIGAERKDNEVEAYMIQHVYNLIKAIADECN